MIELKELFKPLNLTQTQFLKPKGIDLKISPANIAYMKKNNYSSYEYIITGLVVLNLSLTIEDLIRISKIKHTILDKPFFHKFYSLPDTINTKEVENIGKICEDLKLNHSELILLTKTITSIETNTINVKDSLTKSEKLDLYLKEHKVIASNATISRLLDISPRTVERRLNNLN